LGWLNEEMMSNKPDPDEKTHEKENNASLFFWAFFHVF
jgi:hypothetical protein